MFNKANVIKLGSNQCQKIEVHLRPYMLDITENNGQTYYPVGFGLKGVEAPISGLMAVNNLDEAFYNIGLYTLVQILRNGSTDNIYDLVPKTKIIILRDKELLKHMIKIYKRLGINYKGMHNDPHSMSSYLFTTKIAPDIGTYYSRLSNTIYDRYSWEYLVKKFWKGEIPSIL